MEESEPGHRGVELRDDQLFVWERVKRLGHQPLERDRVVDSVGGQLDHDARRLRPPPLRARCAHAHVVEPPDVPRAKRHVPIAVRPHGPPAEVEREGVALRERTAAEEVPRRRKLVEVRLRGPDLHPPRRLHHPVQAQVVRQEPDGVPVAEDGRR